ncbi:MAG: hypothetical protein M3Z84_03410 [Actinomycetota bacterium]|nr:hypothetical protein [Actinomycetota bacterium]
MAGSSGFVATVGGFVIVAGAALGAVRYFGGMPPERGLEGAAGALALGFAVAVPGIAALLSLDHRSALLLPAGMLLVPLSFLSFALVTLPLLIPAVMLFVAFGRRSATEPVAPARAVLSTLSVVGLVILAVVMLFVHQDPRSYTTANGGGSTSDIITFGESVASLAFSLAALTSGWLLATGRGRPPRAGSTIATAGSVPS